jgi:hypothetical protein
MRNPLEVQRGTERHPATSFVQMGHGRFHVPREYDPSMRVPDEVLRCVGFIGEVTNKDEGGVSGELHATGFFVHVPSVRFPGLRFAYFVTAKHVATELKDRNVYILVNAREAGTVPLTNFYEHWWMHPTDKTADLAVLQVGHQDNFDTWGVRIKEFLAKRDVENRTAAIGDEVFMTGLFTEAPGQKRNMPILRHGNIAMFPEEQIQTELGYADVYLVEARSIGGLSGSPAFVRSTITVPIRMNDGATANMSGVGSYKLLGLMHGHWDIKESEINKASIEHDRKRGVNLGIGIVVPAAKIRETLEQEGLVKSRELSEEDLGRKFGKVSGTDR